MKVTKKRASGRGVAKGFGLWYTITRSMFRPILEEIQSMSAETQAAINDMRDAVEASTTVTQSAITLIHTLADQIEQAADDPTEIRALAQEVRNNASALAAAVPANTSPSNADVSGNPAPADASSTDSTSTDTGSGDTGTVESPPSD